MKQRQINSLLSLLSVVMIAVVTFTGCTEDKPTPESGQNTQVSFTVEVTDSQGTVTLFSFTTTEATVGAALLAEGFIEGEVGAFGLMVSHVNGVRADYTEDGAWWKVKINGEDAMVGVDSIPVTEGDTYAFIYTPA